jgi:hypothetical protein
MKDTVSRNRNSIRGIVSRGGRSGPIVSRKESVNVVVTRNGDAITTLRDVDTIEIGDKAKILERGRGFVGKAQPGTNDVADGASNGLRGTGESKVIHLAKEEHKRTFEGGFVNGAVVSSRLEVQGVREENAVDVMFPKTSRFGMALESMTDGKDKRPVKLDGKTVFEPVGIGIVNGDKSRKVGRRRMGKSVLGIGTKDEMVKAGGQGKEESLDGLLNSRTVGGSHGMESRGGPSGAVTAVARAAITIALDVVLPVWAEDNGLGRAGNR